MTTYKIQDENLPQSFIDLDSALNMIEVKGESVKHLFNARNLIKQIFDLIEKVEIKEEKKEE